MNQQQFLNPAFSFLLKYLIVSAKAKKRSIKQVGLRKNL
jgi:hypothetical protein